MFYCEPQLFLFEIGCELEVVFCLLGKSLKYSLGREWTQTVYQLLFYLSKEKCEIYLVSSFNQKQKLKSASALSTFLKISHLKFGEVNKTFFPHKILLITL